MNDIPYSWGTAVNVQMMAFGNLGDTSGTGVAFTRNPATGEKKLFGEFLMNAQGEDVVAGVRTPQHHRPAGRSNARGATTSLWRSATFWKTTTAICRIWSSPLKTASSTCCRPETARRTATGCSENRLRPGGRGHDQRKRSGSDDRPQNSWTRCCIPQFDAAALKKATPVGKRSGRFSRRCLRQNRIHR